MNLAWRRLVDRLRELWASMPPRGRLAAAAVTLAGLAGTVALALLAGGPRYQPVFTGLRGDDLRAVTLALQQRRVDFRVDEPTGSVLVPEPVVRQVRFDLAMEGLPRNGVVGFEVLRETQLGLTDFERRARYLWALQGELVRTIRSIQGVADARVHVVAPERSLFVGEQKEATASVLLTLLPGVQLSPRQVRGIVHLVANSVEGLRPENVTVVDSAGNVLSDSLQETAGAGASNAVAERLQLERQYERELERSLQATLERIWGEGRVLVRVNADLTFDSQEERHEIFSPVVNGRSGIVRSEQRTEESFLGSSAPSGGVPGVSSNVPGYVSQLAQPGGPSEFQRLETVTNYEVNRVERRVVMAPGRIQRLSVAVWIDGELDPAEQQRTEQVVAAAMGLQPQRGDQVTVASMRFARAPEPSATEARLLAAEGVPAVRGVVWWLLALLLVVAAGWWVSRRLRQLRAPAPVAAPRPAAEAAEAVAVPVSPAEVERRRLREEITQLARERPEEFAQLLRSWLVEES
ncbi:MAG TPA: flagellar basal-body MS-ring/collar protein FliF [Limnochordales bacterium]